METSPRFHCGQCRLTWIRLQRLLELKHHMQPLPGNKKSGLALDRLKALSRAWRLPWGTATLLWLGGPQGEGSESALGRQLLFLSVPPHQPLLCACWRNAAPNFSPRRERKVPGPGSGGNQLPGPPGKDQKWTEVGANVQQDLCHPLGDHAGHWRGGIGGLGEFHAPRCRPAAPLPRVAVGQERLPLSPHSCSTTLCSASPISWTTWASREPSCLWASRSPFPADRQASTRWDSPANL